MRPSFRLPRLGSTYCIIAKSFKVYDNNQGLVRESELVNFFNWNLFDIWVFGHWPVVGKDLVLPFSKFLSQHSN